MQYTFEMAIADVEKAETVDQVRDIGCKVNDLYETYAIDLTQTQWGLLLDAFRNRSNAIEAADNCGDIVRLCA